MFKKLILLLVLTFSFIPSVQAEEDCFEKAKETCDVVKEVEVEELEMDEYLTCLDKVKTYCEEKK